jgi:hypothetical protein
MAHKQPPPWNLLQTREMTIRELRDFIASVPFRAVRDIPGGPLNKPPDPHEYVIAEWSEVDAEQFWRFVATIRRLGYRGKYTAPYNNRTMTNWYLRLDGWCYWFIRPVMLNRCRAELKQHEPLGEVRLHPDDSQDGEEDTESTNLGLDSPPRSERLRPAERYGEHGDTKG